MKHPIHSYKELLSKLTSLEKKIALFCKKGQQLPTNAPPALLAKWQSLQQLTTILQQQLQQMEEQLPSPSSLDPLYEEVIEWGKKASTKATIENRKAYQTALNNFLEAHQQEPNSNQQLWAAVAAFCKTELVEGKASLEKAALVKQRIDNLEASEQAKIYCIVKGKEQNGQLWGRIDYVGAAYVMAYANSANGSNNLPLQIRYYTYTNGQYQYEGQSNTLQTSLDKQLMDAFQKSGLTSYEQHKNLDRDYEYQPSYIPKQGKGPWYLTLAGMPATETVAKIIEVPDWEDFGLEKIYEEYLDKCGRGILKTKEREVLKEQMLAKIAQQKKRLQELQQFHVQENDQEENTAQLIEVWKQRIRQYEEEVENLREDCYRPIPKKPSIVIGKPLALDLGGYIIPDEYSDFWDHSRKKWVDGAENALKEVVKILNENRTFIKEIQIDVVYNCGGPSGMTGTQCNDRAQRLFNNTVSRLQEIGLKISSNKIKKGSIKSFQDLSSPIKGARVKITVL